MHDRVMSRPPSARRPRPIGLTGLRGFEAAGRQQSFTKAADELHLTQSSISRQVATLERQLGRPLFVRRTRALALTAAGAQLLQAVQQALGTIDASVDEIRGAPAARRVTLTTYASFASLWLVPRLALFQREHPDVDFRLDASDRLVDLRAEDVDLGIRWMPSDQLPAESICMFDDVAAPALSPRLLSGARLRRPEDLTRWPLLDLDPRVPGTHRINWDAWFAHAKAGRAVHRGRGLVFSFVDQAVQAAVRGQGVALVRSPFLQDAVASGDLVMPFPALRMPVGYRHVLVVNPAARRRPAVEVFVRWLLGQVEHMPSLDG